MREKLKKKWLVTNWSSFYISIKNSHLDYKVTLKSIKGWCINFEIYQLGFLIKSRIMDYCLDKLRRYGLLVMWNHMKNYYVNGSGGQSLKGEIKRE